MRPRASARALRIALGALMVVAWLPPRGGVADDAEDRLARVRQEAADREKQARQYNQQADAILADLESVDREVVESRRSQRRLLKRKKQVEQEIEATQAKIEQKERALDEARENLETRLVAIYKARAGRGVPVIYTAGDFQAGLRAIAGMERVLESDLALFERFRRERDGLEAEKAREMSQIVELDGTKAKYLGRKQRERKALIEKKNLVDLLRARASREIRAANELRGVAERLEAELAKGRTVARAQGNGLRRGQVPRPVEGRVRLGFGRQIAQQSQTVTPSTGIEIEAALGQSVRAVGPGRVLFAGWLQGYGQMILVDHGSGMLTVSGYLEELAVNPGDSVQRGQVIGSVGETGSLSGPGLYFEIRRDNKALDPEAWFQ